jgi:hypothetical protein
VLHPQARVGALVNNRSVPRNQSLKYKVITAKTAEDMTERLNDAAGEGWLLMNIAVWPTTSKCGGGAWAAMCKDWEAQLEEGMGT